LRRESLSIMEHLSMDDSDVIFHAKQWQQADDQVLADLSSRFVNRRLFKAIDLDMPPDERADFLAAARTVVEQAGFLPEYDFVESATGVRAAEKVREALTIDKLAVNFGVVVIDRNLAIAAALGNGFQGSLNLTTQEARDLGAAIGCDFFIIGMAETVKRSPSSGEDYLESYAAILLVSARIGNLV